MLTDDSPPQRGTTKWLKLLVKLSIDNNFNNLGKTLVSPAFFIEQITNIHSCRITPVMEVVYTANIYNHITTFLHLKRCSITANGRYY